MENLRTRDFEDVLHVGGAALDCEAFDQFEDDLLPLIERFIVARSSVYMAISGSPKRWRFSSGFSHGVPDDAPDVWCRRYQSVDPFTRRFLESSRSSPSDIVVSSEVVRRKNYVRTEFYADFLRPQSVHHVMVVGLSRNSKPMGLFGFHRAANEPPFSSCDTTKMRLLVPQLSASMQKIERIENCEERRWIIDRLAADFVDDGIVILDENLAVRYISKTGQNLLGSGAATDIPNELRRSCQHLVAQSGANGDATLAPFKLFGEEPGFEITAHPHLYMRSGHRLRIIIYLQTADATQWRGIIRNCQLARFKLTRRETDVARLVCLGMTNPEIADSSCN